jgi:hypothetical protein
MVGEAKEKMKIRLNQGKKIFIACAAATIIILCAYSLFTLFKQSEMSADASPSGVKISSVQAKGMSYRAGNKYSLSWDSDCHGGNAMVWLSTASSSSADIGILVPLTPFSAASFEVSGQDNRVFFSDIWKTNLTKNANKGKFIWTVPGELDIPKTFFAGKQGVYYIYSLEDGQIALHNIVKQQVKMPTMPDTYYLRVDIKGKNGCTAVGYSQPINIK